jgi:hypothetical protein
MQPDEGLYHSEPGALDLVQGLYHSEPDAIDLNGEKIPLCCNVAGHKSLLARDVH